MAVPAGPGDFLRGGITFDGECALHGVAVAGLPACGIAVLLRKDAGYDPPTVGGSFHSVFYATEVASRDSLCIVGPAVLDAGTGIVTGIVRNRMGVVSASSYSFGYEAFLDGSVRVTEPTGGTVLDGSFVRGGSVAVLGGAVEPAGALPAVQVFVRASAAATSATFAGSYWFVALMRDPVTREYRTLTGSAEADGGGTASWTATANLEGRVTPGIVDAGAYAVAADGALTLETVSGTLSGGVSEDGRFAVLGGGTTAGTPPAIWFFARK
jgi:hypothetical protein